MAWGLELSVSGPGTSQLPSLSEARVVELSAEALREPLLRP